MNENVHAPEDLNQEDTARLIVDFMHRTIMHHAMWFAEVQHQLGLGKGLGDPPGGL